MGARPSAGSEYVIRCPWCDRDGHLYVNTDEGEEWDGKAKPAGRWICFGCGQKSMQFATLLAELDGVSFQEARATIGRWKMGNIRFKRAAAPPPKKDPNAPWLPVEYESVRRIWPRYLTERRISRETAFSFKLGVCRTGPMMDRIILPIDCPAGRSYQARAVLPDMEPRYLSGEGSGQLLFGWHTIADSDLAVIVEGPFDALMVAQAGLPTVALMGKTLRDSQYAMLRQRKRQYYVALDPITKDKTAIDNACEIAERLDGTVIVGLDSDPGDADEAQILASLDTAVLPRLARMTVLGSRLGTLIVRKR